MSNDIHRFKVFHDVVFGSTSWFVLLLVQDLVAFIATAAPTAAGRYVAGFCCCSLLFLFVTCRNWLEDFEESASYVVTLHMRSIGKANTIAIPICDFDVVMLFRTLKP